MFKQLRKIFARDTGTDDAGSVATAVAPRPGFRPLPKAPSPLPAFQPQPAPAPPNVEDEDVSILLQSVLDNLPADLKQRVIPMDLGGATLTVALPKVLSQLPSGSVKLSFGELRGAAPQLFTPGGQADERAVDLPLNELLVRLNPALLPQSPAKTPINTDTREQAIRPREETGQRANGTDAATASGAASPLSRCADPAPTPPLRVPLPNAPASNPMNVPLAALSANWPPAIRAEIAQLDCASGQLNLPQGLVEAGMKVGRVAFTWSTIRCWITPPPPTVISNHDNDTLDLPLDVLMPLFLERWQKTPKTQSRLVVDESIPPLFGRTKAEDETEPRRDGAAAPDVATPSGGLAESSEATPGTDFKNRYTSPMEVVGRACALPGVGGALVILPEGLLVAGKLDPSHDADAVAAFLAHAYRQVSRSASEAKVGNVTRIEFWANDVPWIIFGLDGALLAVFGSGSGNLPAAELAGFATELGKKRGA